MTAVTVLAIRSSSTIILLLFGEVVSTGSVTSSSIGKVGTDPGSNVSPAAPVELPAPGWQLLLGKGQHHPHGKF